MVMPTPATPRNCRWLLGVNLSHLGHDYSKEAILPGLHAGSPTRGRPHKHRIQRTVCSNLVETLFKLRTSLRKRFDLLSKLAPLRTNSGEADCTAIVHVPRRSNHQLTECTTTQLRSTFSQQPLASENSTPEYPSAAAAAAAMLVTFPTRRCRGRRRKGGGHRHRHAHGQVHGHQEQPVISHGHTDVS